MVTFSELIQDHSWVGLGIAGNQAGHLTQAGEDSDFKEVIAAENAPKGMFPWYIPNHESFLGTNPISHSNLRLDQKERLQPEPEVALIVEFNYSEETDTLLEGMKVLGFTAFNDCSNRIAADKISHKKNWGAASQGIAEEIILVNDFEQEDGAINDYRLVCHLERNGEKHLYGLDTPVKEYCYFNQQLLDWMTNQINQQTDFGPLENLTKLLAPSKPRYGVIGIGATCYSDFGNSEARFLQEGDLITVEVYHESSPAKRVLLKQIVG